MLKYISGFDTIKQAWIDLDHFFLSNSKFRIIHLIQELIKSKKGSLSVNNYVLKLRELAYQLESSSYALVEEDKVLYLILGLNRDYEGPI